MIPKILDIVYWPDERLHRPCDKVSNFTEVGQRFHERLGADMIATMAYRSGFGLAAPQVGYNIQMLVMLTIDSPTDNEPLILINPRIVELSDGMFEWREGCISVPGYFETRKRPNRVVVDFEDPAGDTHQREFEGLWAFVLLHEMDHLKGKVFVDDLSSLKKSRVQKKITKTLKHMG